MKVITIHYQSHDPLPVPEQDLD